MEAVAAIRSKDSIPSLPPGIYDLSMPLFTDNEPRCSECFCAEGEFLDRIADHLPALARVTHGWRMHQVGGIHIRVIRKIEVYTGIAFNIRPKHHSARTQN